MTVKAMEWLNQNRHRSYPMRRDAWREKAAPGSGLDCVLLDALLFDSDAEEVKDLVLERVAVSASGTVAHFKYGETAFSVTLEGGEESGAASYESVRMSVDTGRRGAAVSLSFSSHAYIKSVLGEGTWRLDAPVLQSRVLCLSDGYGVDAISTNGSRGVPGRESAADADGDVVLEDGYQASPVIAYGKVMVRVGHRFGLKQCKFDYGDTEVDCRDPLFFFCGQNAVNSGDVVLKGGRGVSVSQGGSYRVKSGTCAGRSVPCIEIAAGRELMDLYVPGS